ncbi:Phytol kinase [Melia azedarach]|uniref:Phytol kinase n=1 Tax=Melia azedarach TaxID=155640 RepID=A0ACC1YB59_MELAZ|nr:Phytol kinase [Melia azedarach]
MSLSFLSSAPHVRFLPFSALSITRRHVGSANPHVSIPTNRAAFPPSHILLLCSGSTSFWPIRVSLTPQRVRVRAEVRYLLQDAGATAAVLAGAYSLVLGFDSLTKRKLIQQNLSRKLVHILSGLLFMIAWPIFSTSTEARYFASLVPLVNCLRLVVNGLSFAKDEGLVQSVTREGNPEELLRGPLFYVLMLILSAVVFWRQSPIGVISLSMMCGGDGVADIIGRRFGSMKIFYNPKKSWAGSISMFVFGFLVSVGMLYFYSILGYFQLDWIETVQRVAFVSLVATVVESLPITEVVDDNISVPLVSMVAAYLSFGD